MQFADWLEQHGEYRHKRWLILGKGPSFDDFEATDCSGKVTLGINHIIRESSIETLDFLHLFDLDLLDQGILEYQHKCRYVIVPERLNQSYHLPFLKGRFFKPDQRSLDQLLAAYPALDALHQQGRLLRYPRADLNPHDGVKLGSFSGATLVSLLGSQGITQVDLCGIDGGEQYSSRFNDLAAENLLVAGQVDFNRQLREIAGFRQRYAMDIKPLNTVRTPVVFVGAMTEQSLAYEVLKFTLDRYSSIKPRVYHLGEQIQQHMPEYQTLLQGLPSGTPFSLQRFAIPQLMNFTGKAIYLDSDMQVFDDIGLLFNQQPQAGGFLSCGVLPEWQREPQLSVLLIDCANAGWRIENIAAKLRDQELDYQQLFRLAMAKDESFRTLSPHWNSLESYSDGQTRLLHYTNMGTQPWLSTENPRATVWCQALLDAVAEGVISQDYVEDHIKRGWVRPSLRWQLEKGVADPLLMPASVRRQDNNFLPPHMFAGQTGVMKLAGLGQANASSARRLFRLFYARLRWLMRVSGVQAVLAKVLLILRKIKTALSTGITFKR